MKKIVALITFLAFFIAKMEGQGDIRFGFQASPVFSWMTTDDNKVNTNGLNVPGLKLGLVGEFYFRENYAIFGGAGFAFNHGGRIQQNREGGGRFWPNSEIPDLTPQDTFNITGNFTKGTNFKYKVQYLEFPIGLRLRTKEFGYLRYYAEIPIFTIGFRAQARGEFDGDDVLAEFEDERYDIKEEVALIAASMGFGFGVEYGISSSTALVAGVHYQRMLTDMTKDNDSDDSIAQMNNIIIRLAVMF